MAALWWLESSLSTIYLLFLLGSKGANTFSSQLRKPKMAQTRRYAA